jgi:lipid-binding SYLF domain-containing protein
MNQRSRTRYIVFTFAGIFLSSLSIAPIVAQKPGRVVPARAIQQSKKATDLLDLAMAKPDERIPKALLEKAVAVAVITDFKKAGLLIEGVGSGRGVVTRRFANEKWGPPAYIHMAAVSIGPQLNASSFNVILLFMNDKAANWLLDKKAVFFDRDRAPVAGPIGEIRTDQKEVIPVADVFSYVFDDGRLQSKDLKNLLKNFGISFDNDLNKATYGATAAEILSDANGNKVPHVPAEVTIFSEAVARFCARESSGPDKSSKP